jgi:hypothetical protein
VGQPPTIACNIVVRNSSFSIFVFFIFLKKKEIQAPSTGENSSGGTGKRAGVEVI